MIAQLAGLQQLVAFTFILTFFGMAAASLFLLLERHQVAAEFRLSVTDRRGDLRRGRGQLLLHAADLPGGARSTTWQPSPPSSATSTGS